MTTGGEIYLAIILAIFLTYAGILFWAMVSGGSVPHTVRVDERHPDAH